MKIQFYVLGIAGFIGILGMIAFAMKTSPSENTTHKDIVKELDFDCHGAYRAYSYEFEGHLYFAIVETGVVHAQSCPCLSTNNL